ncbi:MAG: acyl-homoserine-lactone acylase, partial [Thermoleophilaceae bacterium]|nr:acyl-homoserine-lactone acylase [Thermoleophilaceae bacterium]
MRLAVLAVVALLGIAAPAAAKAPTATITRSAHGVPNIEAKNFEGVAYGYGYAFAQDNICTIADSYVTVNAERSRYFGPKRTWVFSGNGQRFTNLNSDFFFQRINDDKVVEKLAAQKPPVGPMPEILKGVKGYTRGYNQYLEDTGRDNITDPSCRGEPWVRKIKPITVLRRFYELALLASQGVAIDGIATAQPPTPDLLGGVLTKSQQTGMVEELGEKLPLGGLGSNAVALGSEGTRNGSGMLLGNPHFPWDGAERFYQAHLTIPGKVNVSGGSLYGVPIILIGHTDNLAWSHTVSTAFRFTPFELKLVPGSPTSYLVDGQVHKMQAHPVSVKAMKPGGGLETRSRTLYTSEYGPIFTSILGLPLFPWNPATAYAMGDVNANSFRYLNHWFAVNQAQSTDELYDILKKYEGIPWVNTIAADSAGKALYADIGSVPNVTNAKADTCGTAIGAITRSLLGLPVLDGSRSNCNWDTDPDSVQPGIFGASKLPHLFRKDYVTNSNDSYWLSNPEQPLTGYPRIVGAERTARSLRTRLGLRIVQQRLDGSDGLPGKGFTLNQLKDAVFNDRQYAGELWRDQLVNLCRSTPTMLGASGPVDVSEACPVLADWNLHDNLDSKGAVLFRRFASHVLGLPLNLSLPVNPLTTVGIPFSTPFDASDPVNTPRGLDTGDPLVSMALADAVTDLRTSKIPLDAKLGDYQYEMRNGQRIPIHGGPGTLGVFNAIQAPWKKGVGFPDIVHGSSFVMTTSFGKGCPDDRTILTYSESANPKSDFYGDQTKMFSRR